MHFEAIPIQAIKSISQRSLAVHWQALHARRGLPRFADFSPGNRAHDPRQILLWTVDEQKEAKNYRPLYSGDYVFEAFGRDAVSAEALPERLRGPFRAGMEACTASAGVVYMSIATSDAAGHRIACERLLLPFGNGGRNVTHILASLQLVSVEGTFQRQTILQHFEREAEVTFCGQIAPAARQNSAPRAPTGDGSHPTV